MVYKCIDCKYETVDRSNYLKHIRTDKHRRNVEKNVEKSTFLKDNKAVESEKKPQFLCEWCRRYYVRRDTLKRHMKTCKLRNIIMYPDVSKNFVCKYCDNKYENSRSLCKHVNICLKRVNEVEKIKIEKDREIDKLKMEKDIEIEKFKMEKEIDKLRIEKEQAINKEKDRCIEIARESRMINILNTSNKTINFLNSNYGSMIAMSDFLHSLEHVEKLTLKERENLLLSYKEGGIDIFVRSFSYIMKENCRRQLERLGMQDMKLLPLFCSDGNYRSHKEKELDGWKTHYDNNNINKMLNISNNQIHEIYEEIVPVVGKDRSKLYREVKKDNHENKLLIKG